MDSADYGASDTPSELSFNEPDSEEEQLSERFVPTDTSHLIFPQADTSYIPPPQVTDSSPEVSES